MKQIRCIQSCFLLACMAGSLFVQANPGKELLQLISPDGKNKISLFQKSKESSQKEFVYCVTRDGKTIIPESLMGLELNNEAWENALAYSPKVEKVKSWNDNFRLDSVISQRKDTTWHPLYGERSTIRDNYQGATLYFSKPDRSSYRMTIEVRAYDEGVAFRFGFPMHPDAVFHKITDDLTQYRLPEGSHLWCAQWAQAPYERLSLSELEEGRGYERPLTVELPNGKWLSITDAQVDNWCLTLLGRKKNAPDVLGSILYSPVDLVTPFSSPWKVILTGDSPGELLTNNTLIENLNPPCLIADANQWIKPGKIMRETTLTTKNALACIDFCAAHGMQYILFDWKWYGPSSDYRSDATKVVAPIDMPRVVQHGKEKGIGIWLYINHHALERQARQLFPVLHEWGIAGVKFGFVEFKSHRWATWMHEMVRLAAENHLMVNIHDEFRPSGYSRTWPNLLTQEGIRGNEEFPDATHNTILPFTRMLSGAADYTICYYDPRLQSRSHVTHAHQLAASLVFYSPLLTLFWYDSPSDYKGEAEISWFENLPTTFDESKVLSGTPGEYITMARRHGQEWFVAILGNKEGRTVEIPLSFLKKGKKYEAYVYTHGGESVPTATQVKCNNQKVKGGETLRFTLAPSDGVALRLAPQ